MRERGWGRWVGRADVGRVEDGEGFIGRGGLGVVLETGTGVLREARSPEVEI